MDLGNLATVICPSILYARGANAARDESFIAITAVQDMLENQDEYYTVPAELRFVIDENIYNIFAKELDLPPKEIHRHCSKYMQARGQPSPALSGGSRVPTSSSGQIRDRPSDSRLSAHRSVEGNLSLDSQQPGSGPMPIPYRPAPLSQTPTNSMSNTYPHPPAQSGSRPASYMQSNTGSTSQQSLNLNLAGLVSPGSATGQSGGPVHQHWRGPFHGVGATGNGSRNSSRGSAPSSPGPEERGGRGSMQIDREKEGRRTPVSQDHR